MAEVTSIHPADLREIENNLRMIHSNIETLNYGVNSVQNEVNNVYDKVGALAQEFHAFVDVQNKANRLNQAETRLVKIRQELENKYGHYDIVRRTTTGILQADDLGIVRKETVTTASEEIMLSTPNYWLAPCLVALSAWINDQKDLADTALHEAIKRNDEKTSLFFALICMRSGRKNACLKWTQRYLAAQDEGHLDRKTIIVLDAYASGLLGADTEGYVSKQIESWLDELSSKPGFVERQKKQWSDAINLKRKPYNDDSYHYLTKYSRTWPILSDIMTGAKLHADILAYFTDIFEQEVSSASIKEQLDEILTSLVTDFDDEEIPLRKQETFEQFIVDYNGDERRAQQSMKVEESAFETEKDFTQLLTDAAMKPESSHASNSTQKFSIALTKDWIVDAYNDVTLNNRMKIPHDIEINIDSFNDKTVNGENEQELVASYNTMIDAEKEQALSQQVLTMADKFSLFAGAMIAVVGLIMMFAGNGLLGIIAVVVGVWMVIRFFGKKKNVETNRQNIETQFEQKRETGTKILRATVAEVVDFRREFAARDAESQKVIDFLEEITPDQYVRKLSGQNRRIKAV